MDVLFVRHGSAEPAGREGDSARRLTAEGKEESRRTARALVAMGVDLQAVLTSPLVRAAETAGIVAKVLGASDPIQADCLAPPGDVEELRTRLKGFEADGAKAVAVVGHAPSLDEFIARLAAGADDVGISLSKAGAACVTLPAPRSAKPPELRWLMHRRQLAMIAGGR